MSTLHTVLIRWVIALACALPLVGCGQDLPLPEGVNKDAKPQIIVKQGDIFIDGKKITVRKSKIEDWIATLGTNSSNGHANLHWSEQGLGGVKPEVQHLMVWRSFWWPGFFGSFLYRPREAF